MRFYGGPELSNQLVFTRIVEYHGNTSGAVHPGAAEQWGYHESRGCCQASEVTSRGSLQRLRASEGTPEEWNQALSDDVVPIRAVMVYA